MVNGRICQISWHKNLYWWYLPTMDKSPFLPALVRVGNMKLHLVNSKSTCNIEKGSRVLEPRQVSPSSALWYWHVVKGQIPEMPRPYWGPLIYGFDFDEVLQTKWGSLRFRCYLIVYSPCKLNFVDKRSCFYYGGIRLFILTSDLIYIESAPCRSLNEEFLVVCPPPPHMFADSKYSY